MDNIPYINSISLTRDVTVTINKMIDRIHALEECCKPSTQESIVSSIEKASGTPKKKGAK